MNKNKQELFWVVFGVVLVLLLIMAFSLFSSERPLGEASQCIKGVGKCNGQIFTPGDDNSVGEEEQMFAKDSIYEEGCAIVPPEPDDECIPPHIVSKNGLCVKPECVNSGNGNGGGNGNGNGDEQVCSGPCNADEGFVKDGDGVCVCEDSNIQPRKKLDEKGYTCLGEEEEKTSCKLWGCPLGGYQLTANGKSCIRCGKGSVYNKEDGTCVKECPAVYVNVSECLAEGGKLKFVNTCLVECEKRDNSKEEEEENEEEITCPDGYESEFVNVINIGLGGPDGCDYLTERNELDGSCPSGMKKGFFTDKKNRIIGNEPIWCVSSNSVVDCVEEKKACVPVSDGGCGDGRELVGEECVPEEVEMGGASGFVSLAYVMSMDCADEMESDLLSFNVLPAFHGSNEQVVKRIEVFLSDKVDSGLWPPQGLSDGCNNAVDQYIADLRRFKKELEQFPYPISM